jgi:uncharacterized protein YjlB
MQVEHFLLVKNGWVPNNSRLPILLYRGAVKGSGERAAVSFEKLFDANGWPPDWRDVIYDYHHYHSTAHEALGVAKGSATLMLGGSHSMSLDVAAGDALVLPVGTGHRGVKASADFLVVGAYPTGQDWDVCREAPTDAMLRRMRKLPIPPLDPVMGQSGPLGRHWPSATRP